MTDYGEYLQSSRGPSLVRPTTDAIHHSLTRNSYYDPNTSSVSASTRSWVHSTQQYPPGSPPPPPPLPIPLPTPVQRLRPLPNPHVQHYRASVLHAINPSEPLYREDEAHMDVVTNPPDPAYYRKAGSSQVHNPGTSVPGSVNNAKGKKRTVMRGLVKSIRKIPKMFGYGASTSKGTTNTLRRRVNLDTPDEGSPTTVTGGNALPQYVSNPPTPVAGPMTSNLQYYTHQPAGMQMQMPIPVARSPPPEVVRLNDVRRHRPSFRIMPPSVNIARSETAHFFPGPNATTRSSQYTDDPTDSSSSAAAVNTADRTTVMLYHHDDHTPTPTATAPTPPPPISRQISSNGPPGRFSHVGSEQIVRPTSFHGGSQAPPIEIPRTATPSSHLSYVSQTTAVPTTLPLNIRRSPSQRRSQLSNQSQPPSQSEPQSEPRQHQRPSISPQPSTPPPIIESSEPILSPISVHPQPTTDYLKMAVSPPHSFQHIAALSNLASNPSSSRITSFSHDPSFSSTSSPIERFFKTLYRMPWVAYGRITVDYLPGRVGPRVHGHALTHEKSRKRGREGRRREDDRRRRGTKDTRERDRDRDRDRDRRRRRERRSRRRGDGGDYVKPASWYQAVLTRSKRTSAELDLLSSDPGSQSSKTTTSLGAAIGLELKNLPDDAASPRLAAASASAAAMKIGKSAERERKKMGDKQQTSRSRHHHDPPGGRQRRMIDSLGSPDGPDIGQVKGNEDEGLNRSPSPLIPTVYPFHYPPYPYTYPYTAFTMPPPGPPPVVSAHAQSQSQRPSPSPQNPPGPTSSAHHKQQGQHISQPLLYSPGIPHSGYTTATHAYQPMMAPQVYLLHSTSHGQLQAQMQMQPLSSSGHVDNGGGVLASGAGTDDSGQQQVLEP